MPTKASSSRSASGKRASRASAKSTAAGKSPYALALEQENLKLQRRIARLEAELMSSQNRIRVLEEAKPEAAVRSLSDAELESKLEEHLRQAGYVKAVK